MSVGFLMLCHTALDRAAQVARHWATQGCPVVIARPESATARAFQTLAQRITSLTLATA